MNKKLTSHEKSLIRRYCKSILNEIKKNPFTNDYLIQQVDLLKGVIE